MTASPEQQTELEQAAEVERRAVALILDLRATITRLMGELKLVAEERDRARRDLDAMRLVTDPAAKARLEHALLNHAAPPEKTA